MAIRRRPGQASQPEDLGATGVLEYAGRRGGGSLSGGVDREERSSRQRLMQEEPEDTSTPSQAAGGGPQAVQGRSPAEAGPAPQQGVPTASPEGGPGQEGQTQIFQNLAPPSPESLVIPGGPDGPSGLNFEDSVLPNQLQLMTALLAQQGRGFRG